VTTPAVRHLTLTTLREKLIKIGAKVVRHSRKIVFQMAEVAVPRELFQTILERIGRLSGVFTSSRKMALEPTMASKHLPRRTKTESGLEKGLA